MSKQLSILDPEAMVIPVVQEQPKFVGDGFDPELDQKRLEDQIWRIYNLMKDGYWRTYEEIEKTLKIKYPGSVFGQASISAQLRNLRKPANGSHVVCKRRRGEKKSGLYEYQLTVNNGKK